MDSAEERDRFAAAIDALERFVDDGPDGSDAALLRTFTETTYPTVAASVYACHPVSIGVAETEGATPTFTVDTTRTIYALNIGTQIPATGTNLIGHVCGGRWVFDWMTPP